MIASFAGKPTETEQSVNVRTSDPRRDIAIKIGPKSVVIESSSSTVTPDLELPAEALIRLVYGRLDPAHTPTMEVEGDLPTLRETFRGF